MRYNKVFALTGERPAGGAATGSFSSSAAVGAGGAAAGSAAVAAGGAAAGSSSAAVAAGPKPIGAVLLVQTADSRVELRYDLNALRFQSELNRQPGFFVQPFVVPLFELREQIIVDAAMSTNGAYLLIVAKSPAQQEFLYQARLPIGDIINRVDHIVEELKAECEFIEAQAVEGFPVGAAQNPPSLKDLSARALRSLSRDPQFSFDKIRELLPSELHSLVSIPPKTKFQTETLPPDFVSHCCEVDDHGYGIVGGNQGLLATRSMDSTLNIFPVSEMIAADWGAVYACQYSPSDQTWALLTERGVLLYELRHPLGTLDFSGWEVARIGVKLEERLDPAYPCAVANSGDLIAVAYNGNFHIVAVGRRSRGTDTRYLHSSTAMVNCISPDPLDQYCFWIATVVPGPRMMMGSAAPEHRLLQAIVNDSGGMSLFEGPHHQEWTPYDFRGDYGAGDFNLSFMPKQNSLVVGFGQRCENNSCCVRHVIVAADILSREGRELTKLRCYNESRCSLAFNHWGTSPSILPYDHVKPVPSMVRCFSDKFWVLPQAEARGICQLSALRWPQVPRREDNDTHSDAIVDLRLALVPFMNTPHRHVWEPMKLCPGCFVRFAGRKINTEIYSA